MTLERDTVIWAYRLLLGREPESEAVIELHQQLRDLATLRSIFVNSLEYKCRPEWLNNDDAFDMSAEYERDCTVFVHVPKTAGTSLHELLVPYFPADRVSPERFNVLHSYAPRSLSRYDFYSGHFDLFSLRFIPRSNPKVISLFREPRARLLSMYYFCRLHPAESVNSVCGWMVPLANAHDVEGFFSQPVVRSSPEIWNSYAMTFGAHLLCERWEDAIGATEGRFVNNHALAERAIQNIRRLHAFGIVERMNESVEFIFQRLQLPQPSLVPRRQAFDSLPDENPLLHRVEKIPASDQVNALLDELVCLDEKIYSEAQRLFQANYRHMKKLSVDVEKGDVGVARREKQAGAQNRRKRVGNGSADHLDKGAG